MRSALLSTLLRAGAVGCALAALGAVALSDGGGAAASARTSTRSPSIGTAVVTKPNRKPSPSAPASTTPAPTPTPTATPTPAAASWVTRVGSGLQLNGNRFRFAGANIYWLGLDENTATSPSYPTKFRIKDALDTAALMGATVVRSHSLGVSVGCALCLEPSLDSFNDAAFDPLGFAVATAGQEGLRLVIPLTDNYHYYNGGKHTFADWYGLPEDSFYTDARAVAAFQRYVSHLLNHVNSYTGVALKDDPTVLAFETGNELSTAPAAWTQQLAAYLKALAPRTLVIDAHDLSGPQAAGQLTGEPDVDIYTGHYYPMNATELAQNAAQAQGAGRAFIVGEYGWLDDTSTALPTWLSAIESTSGVSGDLYWSLFGHNDGFGYEQHRDGFTLHFPGDTADQQTRVAELRNHAYAMSGRITPAYPLPPTPTITAVAAGTSSTRLLWQGVAGAASYTVQRSADGVNWVTDCDRCVTDNGTPWTDAAAGSSPTGWYRLAAVNADGRTGGFSAPYRVGTPISVVTFESMSSVQSKVGTLVLDGSNPQYFNGDTSRLTRGDTGADSITVKVAGTGSFQASAYFWPGEPQHALRFSTSADGVTYTDVAVTAADFGGNWDNVVYTANSLTNVSYVRVTWQSGGQAWNPQLAEMRFSS